MPNKQEELQEKDTDFTVTSAGAVIEESAAAETVEEVEAPTAEADVAEPETEDVDVDVTEDVETAEVEEDFAKKDETPSDDSEEAEDADEEDEDKDEPKNKHSLSDNEDIMAELAELREFKLNYERAQKDEVINKYHMLSDEDKADVVAHKDEYTLEQIDEKLALVYVRKNVDFSTVDGRPETEETVAEEAPLLAFSLDDSNIMDNAEPVDGLQDVLRELFR